MSKFYYALRVTVALFTILGNSLAFEEHDVISNEEFSNSESSEEVLQNDTSPKDLYIIRKVVYEIGILTDATNSSDYDNRTHEQIDVSFFDPVDNGTFVDLSKIPIPVETNVSGVALTGILTSNLGSLLFPENDTEASLNRSQLLLFPDKQVRVTKNISTVDKEQSANLLSGLTQVLGLSKLVTNYQTKTTTEKLP
ncbi:uncharacterized protein [Euwallacea fornicatus]|uniref:uncharacterized protein n=1 Tax=Euwallacea fornicatus TaxID=995702 RepID=UPI00338F4952